MLFMVQCFDKKDHLEMRKATRPDHLQYLQGRLDHVVMAGALLAEDGETMIGSGYVLDFPARGDVEAFFAGDPYVQAGLYAEITIRPYRKALP